ncbi:hypothetical protein HanIR_Chr08g0364431 [Helianthus annuus]|nr:hypothetical protein HanIR_Chr08g0364431 [Helianthus annuus]
MEVVEAVTAWRCYGGGGFSGDVGVRWWRRGGCVMLGRFSGDGGVDLLWWWKVIIVQVEGGEIKGEERSGEEVWCGGGRWVG